MGFNSAFKGLNITFVSVQFYAKIFSLYFFLIACGLGVGLQVHRTEHNKKVLQ